MKKLYLIFAFILLFNGYEETNDISIELSRDHNDNIFVVWNIEVENPGRIYLYIEHENSTHEYELPSLSGQVNLCCYAGDVQVKIIVHTTQAIDLDDDECNAISCVEFIKVEYFQEQFSLGTTTTTTSPVKSTSTTQTTTTIATSSTTTSTITTVHEIDTDDKSIKIFNSLLFNKLVTNTQNFFYDINTYISTSFQNIKNIYTSFNSKIIYYSIYFLISFLVLFLLRRNNYLLIFVNNYKYTFAFILLTFIFVFLPLNERYFQQISNNDMISVPNSSITTTVTDVSTEPITTPTTYVQTDSFTTTTKVSSTTISDLTIVGISEDSESVQIIDESIDEDSQYQGPFLSFFGYEGDNQPMLDTLKNNLPNDLKNIIEHNVIFINGCHEYAKSIVGRCPYGVWDSSGTNIDGTKGAEWKLSIWISNRAFDSGEANDVLIHEASHALSFLTRDCQNENNSNLRKDAWDYFDGEENFADALVLYFGGTYNHYRDSGALNIEEEEFINKYINTCSD